MEEGELLIIVSQVGAGKSSLLRLVQSDMIYVSEEEIKFAGGLNKPLSKTEFDGLKTSIIELKVKK